MPAPLRVPPENVNGAFDDGENEPATLNVPPLIVIGAPNPLSVFGFASVAPLGTVIVLVVLLELLELSSVSVLPFATCTRMLLLFICRLVACTLTSTLNVKLPRLTMAMSPAPNCPGYCVPVPPFHFVRSLQLVTGAVLVNVYVAASAVAPLRTTAPTAKIMTTNAKPNDIASRDFRRRGAVRADMMDFLLECGRKMERDRRIVGHVPFEDREGDHG